MSSSAWVVHKFGGTSLAGVAAFRRVQSVLAERKERQAIVVSATAGTTDSLLALVAAAADRDKAIESKAQVVLERHKGLAAELLNQNAADSYCRWLEKGINEILGILHGVSLLGTASEETSRIVSGYGELWSARLLSDFLNESGADSAWIDARNLLVVRHGELGPAVLWDESQQRVKKKLLSTHHDATVITGYIASTAEGLATTLGRNGSDFSAAIFGRLLDAEEICIWTDVDGVMTGDPRLIPDAQVIQSLSYNEAVELAYFGARILHPQTMAPAIECGIPIHIFNTFNPESRGTLICAQPEAGPQIKGITTIDNVVLVNLEGTGMIGVPGTANRLFGALKEGGISVILISQGSSEHSICFVIAREHLDRAREVLDRAFHAELAERQIQNIEFTPDVCILAIVGDGMAGTPGVAGQLFKTLGGASVNVRAIAQGSSERNISAVIDSAEKQRAMRAVHSGFYLSPQTLSIGIIGPGNIGAELMDQMAGEISRLANQSGLDLRVRGIASSQHMLLSDGPVDLANWREAWTRNRKAVDMSALAEHIRAEHLPHAVMIDCTASESIARLYGDWLAEGIHVVTPNKKASTGKLEYYKALHQGSRSNGSHFLYETTVGAGLPIIQTLRDLCQTGDKIHSVSGIFSGTLAYLFNRYDGSVPFSEIVGQAAEKGFTEPDPRDDLSGMDVARKLVILGREMGLELELESVDVESLVPEDLLQLSVADFLGRLSDHDQDMKERWHTANEAGQVLRYVGRLDETGQACVKLESLPGDHAFAHISLTDNIVLYSTERYSDNPLIVQGPGAGPAVTAAGVFADLLRLSAYLGAHL